jgi:hypothetical protein
VESLKATPFKNLASNGGVNEALGQAVPDSLAIPRTGRGGFGLVVAIDVPTN